MNDSYSRGLYRKWDTLTVNLMGAPTGLSDNRWFELKVLFSSPDRYYHTFSHIKQFYRRFAFLTPKPLVGVSALISIFYHDAVYNPKGDDNEERSADYVVEVLKEFGQPEVRQEIARDLILATKTHKPLQGGLKDLSEYFLDADLSVLGSNPAAYEVYSLRIRKEYSWVPDEIYKEKRAEILENFLRRPSIFYTNTYKGLYEEKAKNNINWELQILNA